MRTRMMLLGLVAALGLGCKDTGKSDEGGSDGGSPLGDDGGGDGGDGVDGGDGGDGGDPACWVASDIGDCWDCPLPEAPDSDSSKALNQCNTTGYVVFDNSERIPASTWVEGDPLPALP
jgi:hypothetical protein